jgi:hypothetical protein
MLLRATTRAAARSFSAAAAATYSVPQAAIESFRTKGWAVLPGFLSEAEIKPIEASYDKFMRGEVPMHEKDFMDMSQSFAAIKGKHPDDWQIVNAMLPRKYMPAMANNVYERRAAHAVAQLFPGVKMALDYDQLLNKRPGKAGAVFAWHQDMQVRRRTNPSHTCPTLSSNPRRSSVALIHTGHTGPARPTRARPRFRSPWTQRRR